MIHFAKEQRTSAERTCRQNLFVILSVSNNMKCSIARQLLLLAVLVFSPSVFAEEEDDGSEDTMVVVQAGATPEDIVFELPFDAKLQRS